MKYILSLALLLTTIFTAVTCSSPARKLADEGDLLFTQHKYNEAIASYNEALKADPKIILNGQLANAYMGKAEESYSKQNYTSLPDYYNEAVGLNPEIANGTGSDLGNRLYLAGTDYMLKQEWVKAVDAFSAAVDIGYASEELHLKRAGAYIALNLNYAAVSDCYKALALNPDSVSAYKLRGIAYYQAGEYDKALEDYSRAISGDASDKQVYFNRAMVWIAKGYYDLAIRNLGAALDIDRTYIAAGIWLGRAYFKKSQYYAAIDQFTATLAGSSAEAMVVYNDRAVSLGKTGKFNEALQDLDTLIAFNPKFYPAYYNRGVILMKMAQVEKAIGDLTVYLCLDSNDYYGYACLAEAWRNCYGNYFLYSDREDIVGEAVKRCGAIILSGKGYPDLLHSGGHLYFQSERGGKWF